MSNLKISQLTGATTPLAGTETLPVVQSGSTVKVSVANLTAGRAVATAGGSFTDNITQSTAAKGINFTANTSAAGMTSQLLNWYEEGTFTPTITAGTAGNLSVSYSTQLGRYTRIGNRCFINITLVTSAFTWTTASGLLYITGLPFSANSAGNNNQPMGFVFGGVTKTGYTQFAPFPDYGYSQLVFGASGTGVVASGLTIADLPSGGTIYFAISGQYQI
jgi:hypothetical protein